MLFQQNEQSKKPLYLQLSDTLRDQITSGALEPGTRLPSTRNYATESGLSRTSVVTAFEQLRAEGYLSARRGSGYYVSRIGPLDTNQHKTPEAQTTKTSINIEPQAGHPGATDMRLFPYRKWAQCVSRTARMEPESLIKVTDPFGDMQLRKAIARYLIEWRGIDVSAQQILVTAGSIDALEICVRTLVTDHSSIGLENPGYLPIHNFIRQFGLSPMWLTVDKYGARLPKQSAVLDQPRLAIVTPSYQFPLGTIMSPRRRSEFIQWAAQSDSWIIEDDYDSEFRYAGQPIPALASMDTMGRTLYVGSFSKIFSKGLRLGFLVLPMNLLDQFSTTLIKFPSKTGISMQRPLANFMNNGELFRHIRRVRRIYGERRQHLIMGLESTLEGLITIDDYQAGTQLVAHLPNHLNDRLIASKAKELGVPVAPLSAYYQGKVTKNGLVLGFCEDDLNEIQNHVTALKLVFRNVS